MHSTEHKPRAEPTATPGIRDVVLIGLLSTFGAISIDLYLPALPAIAADFGAPLSAVQATMSAFLLGMAVGQLFFGPLSDRMGRRGPLLAGILLYVVASLALTVAPTLDWLTAGRFVQALGACAGMVISRAIVRDRFSTTESARLFSLTFLIVGVAPMLAPSVGAALLEFVDWHMLFVVLAVFGAVAGVITFLHVPESRTEETAAQARSENALQAYAAALSDRRVLGYIVAAGLNGAALFAYIATSPGLFMEYYGRDAHAYGLIFTLNAVGLVISSQANRWMLKRMPPARLARRALMIAMGFALLLLGLSLAMAHVPLGLTVALLFLVLGSYGFVGANLSALALGVMPARAGVVSALSGSATFAFGALASAITAPFVESGPITMATAIVLGSAGSLLALWVLVDGGRWAR